MVDYVNNDYDVIIDIIEKYIKSKHNICSLFSDLLTSILEFKNNDKKLVQLVKDFMIKKQLNKLDLYAYHIYFVNFAISLFEYFLTVDYISIENKAMLFVSIFNILHDSYDPTKYKADEIYQTNVFEFKEKIDKIIIDKIIKQKNDDLFYFMLKEADRIDEEDEKIRYDLGEDSGINVMIYFIYKYKPLVKKYEMAKSLKYFNDSENVVII